MIDKFGTNGGAAALGTAAESVMFGSLYIA